MPDKHQTDDLRPEATRLRGFFVSPINRRGMPPVTGDKKTPRNLPARGPGRPKGTPNRTTAMLKDAILGAADAVGEDGRGKGKLKGYCQFLAREEPKAFAQLLGKVIPLQIQGDPNSPLTVVIRQFSARDHSPG